MSSFQGKIGALVVQALNTENNKDIVPNFNCSGFKYWLIKHDNDKKDDGTPKTPHYHVVFEITEKKTMSYFMDLAKKFFDNITNDNQVSIDVIQNKYKRDRIRYLTHLDYPDRYQYNDTEVKTNDKETYRNCIENAITIDYVLDVISKSDGMTDVIRKLGLDTYKCYQHAIDILWKENK